MTVVAHTLARPQSGKGQMAENRARQLAGIYARHGAAVKVSKIVSGPGTGCISMLRGYSDFRTAASAFQAINSDPAHVAFWQERGANPAADIVIGRDIMRTVFGEHQWRTHPVSQVRRYELPRNKLVDALKLFPEVAEVVSAAGVNVVGLLPITGENLSSLVLAYQFRSIDHWGEALDTVGTSEAFQAIVARAAEIGTLRASFTSVPL